MKTDQKLKTWCAGGGGYNRTRSGRVPVAFRNKCERVTGPQPERIRSICVGVNATRTSGTGPERDWNANRNRCEHGLSKCDPAGQEQGLKIKGVSQLWYFIDICEDTHSNWCRTFRTRYVHSRAIRYSLVHLFQNTLRPPKNCNRIVLNGFVFSNYLKTTYTKSAKIESAIAA